MKPKIKPKIKLALKLLVAAALITFVFRSGHLKLESIRELLTPFSIASGFVLIGVNLWLLNWRWYWLLRSIDFPISLSRTFSMYLIGVFFNHALPSSVGGDVVKAFYIARHHEDRRMEAVLSVLIDRVLGLYSLLLISVGAIVFDLSFVLKNPGVRVMAGLTLGLVGGMTIAFIIGFSSRIDRALGFTAGLRRWPKLHKIAEVFEAMQLFGKQRSAIAISVAVGILGQLVTLFFFYCVGYSLGFVNVPLAAYIFCMPLGFLATALPISPAGVGVGQFAFLYLFQAYAPSSGDLGAVAITAFQLAVLVWGGIGAIFYVKYREASADAA